MKFIQAQSLALLFAVPCTALNFRHQNRKLIDMDEITVFTFRQAWQGALVGQSEEWCVDFEQVPSDLDFLFLTKEFADNSAGSTTRFSLVANGPTNNSRLNKIDVAPFEDNAPDIDISGGSTYARMHVEGDSDITVTMLFDEFGDDRVVAWGASFLGTQTNEAIELELHFESGEIVSDSLFPSDGFFGFILQTELLKMIRFKANIPDGNLGGETFGLDDVCGTSTRPSPAPSESPSAMPSFSPSEPPTLQPTVSPTESPTRSPTKEKDFCLVRKIPIIGDFLCAIADFIAKNFL